MTENIIRKVKAPEAIENPADIVLGDKPVIVVKRGYNDDTTGVEILDKAAEIGVVVLVVPRNADVERIL